MTHLNRLCHIIGVTSSNDSKVPPPAIWDAMLGANMGHYCVTPPLPVNCSILNIFWVILNNQSTVIISFKAALLVGTQTINESINIHTNGGETAVNMYGFGMT